MFSLSGAGRYLLLQAPRSSFSLRSPQYLVAVAFRCSSTSSSFLGRLGSPPRSLASTLSASPSILRFSLSRLCAGAVSLSHSLLDLAVSSTISWRDSRSSPSPGSSFSCQFLGFPIPGPFSWCSYMRWVPSSCCFSCYPLLPGCAYCTCGVSPPPFFFSSSSHAFSSLFGLWRCSYDSSSFLSWVFLRCPDFSSSISSWVVFFGFPSVCTEFSFPLSFCSLCVHGSGAFIFPATFFPCRIISWGPLSIASLLQLVILLPGVMLPLSFHCHSFRGPLTIFGLVPHLSVVSSSISGLILLCQFSPVFCRVLSSFDCTSVEVSSISSLLDSPSGWQRVFLHGSSLSWSPSSTASSGHRRRLLSLSLGLPPLSAVLRFSVLSASSVVVSFSLSPFLVAPWGFLLFFAWAPGGFVSVLTAVSAVMLNPCYFLSAILPLMVYIPTFRCLPSLAAVSSVPVRSYFFLFVWALGCLAWFPCSASPSLVYIPLSFLQVVSSFLSLGALLTLSNLRFTTRWGLPLGRVSF